MKWKNRYLYFSLQVYLIVHYMPASQTAHVYSIPCLYEILKQKKLMWLGALYMTPV